MLARPAAAESSCDGALAARVLAALETAFPGLGRNLRKTLAVVSTGFLAVMAAARGGDGAPSPPVARPLFSRPGSRRRVPLLFDQMQAGPAQALVVAVVFAGRALPLSLRTSSS